MVVLGAGWVALLMDNECLGLARNFDHTAPLGMGVRAYTGFAGGVVEELLDGVHEFFLGHLADRLDDEAGLSIGGQHALFILLLTGTDYRDD